MREKQTRPRAVIYCRASLDATGKEESVHRQEQACRMLADIRGWDVVAVEVDNSISAYDEEKVRPGWDRVLGMMEDGTVDVLVAWHLDRLTRSMLALERLILLAEKSKVGVATATGDIDLTTDTGRMVARILAAVARAEVERKGARAKLANKARADKGIPWGSGPRAFGYDQSGLEIIESEAAAIREAATLVINGTPLNQIARLWMDRGLVSTHAANGKANGTGKGGKGWSARGVRNVLLSPRYAGRRVYNGEDLGEGVWTPILDLDTYLAVREKLEDPSRFKGPGLGRAPQTLLTGIARCGTCGHTVKASVSRGRLDYKCRNFCVQMPRAFADEWVGAWIVDMASDPNILTRLNPQGDAEVEKAKTDVAESRERLDRLATSFALGAIDQRQLEAGTKELRRQLDAAEAILASNGRAQALGDLLASDDVAGEWERLPLARARRIVETLVTVRLNSPGKARPVVWDPERLVEVAVCEEVADAA